MPTILLNNKVKEGQAPSATDVKVRELSIDPATGSLWTQLKNGIVRRIQAIATPHSRTHSIGGADAITPSSIGAAIIDHQHTPIDFVGCGDILTSNVADFAAATHTHGIGQVTGLSAQLDALAQRISAIEQQIHPQ
jgi:hypothetical protein